MNKQNSNNILLHLSLIDGVGPAAVRKIIHNKPSDMTWDALYTFDNAAFLHEFGVSNVLAKKIVNGLKDKQTLEKELDLINRYQVKWTTFLNSDYPDLLKHIHTPPIVLYWHGQMIKNSEKTIAIVGARKANHYGQRIIKNLVPKLVQHNWTIVSGGALGADSMAHHATVQVGGKTVVVLGSGLLQPYPSSNRQLFNQVCASGGMVLSAFPLQMKAMAGNFPARNRIISGLSKGCIVIQAAEKSGARITAHYALEQGREVFAVPGPVDDLLSIGCHLLIKEGAQLINNVDDILKDFGDLPYIQVKKEIAVQPELGDDSIEGRIIRACHNPSSMDDLVVQTGLSLPELQAKLFDLQLMGTVAQDFTGMWFAQ